MNQTVVQEKPIVNFALEYIRRGWAVIPMHSVTPWGCSCQKTECSSIGKHPRTKNGVKDASTDEQQVENWWKLWPDANIGIVTGKISGLIALDIDPRHGGDTSFSELEMQHGRIADTIESHTGGGGRHILFSYPGVPIKNKVNFEPGLDIRSDDGCVVAPPSLHASGRRYIWDFDLHPDSVPLNSVPDWLLAKLSSVPASYVHPHEQKVFNEGHRKSSLVSMAGAMRRVGFSERAILDALQVTNLERCHPPLGDEDVRDVAHSIAKYQTAGISPAGKKEDMWPTPLGEKAFHGIVGEIIKTIDPHTEADPSALLVQFLVAFGNMVGRQYHFLVEADQHPPNLFAVLVGESAKGRKGTSWRHILNLISKVDENWQKSCVKSGLSSGEGLIWQVRDPIKGQMQVKEKGKATRYDEVIQDKGVEDKRLLVCEGEFASILKVVGREGNTLSPVIRNAWDTGNLETLTKNSPGRSTDAHISIIGHITKYELKCYLDKVEAANGFGNRFLWVCVKRSKVLPHGGSLKESMLNGLSENLLQITDAIQSISLVKRDQEANQLWEGIYEKLSEGKPGMFGALVGRAEAQVTRLSVIYALLDASASINTQHLEAALEVWRYCEDSCRYIFGDAIGDPAADSLLAALRNQPQGMTRTEIQELFNRNKSSKEIGRALTVLQDLGLVSCVIEPGMKRSIERWFAMTTDSQEVLS